MRDSIIRGRASVAGFNHLALKALAAATISVVAANAAMAASTWTGPAGTTASPTTGNWNAAGNWNPSGVPASSLTTELDFLGSTTYTATDDIAGAFTLNTLKVNGNASSIAAAGNNSLTFSGTAPTLNQLGAGIFTIAAPVNLANGVTVNQINGGEIDFTSALTTSSGGSLNLTNSSGTGNSIVKLTGSNTFIGLTVNAHVTATAGLSASFTTLGAGSVTLAGGTLQLQGQQLTGTTATQQIIPLQASNFTRDIVYENPGGTVSGGGVDGGSGIYENGFDGGSMGLPTTALNRTFQSAATAPQGNTSVLATRPTFQFQPYNTNNAMLVQGSATTLALASPTKMNRAEFLYTGSLPGNVDVNVSFNFANGNTSTGTYTFTPQDWYSSHAFTALDGGTSNGPSVFTYSGNISEVDFALNAADSNQPITGVVFTPTSSLGDGVKGLDVMALSGAAFSAGLAGTQTYANDLIVTADSGINISGSLTASMGNLTIGANKLSIASSDTSGAPYSLTLGRVTLNGTGAAATTFDVVSSAGNGVATLNLGPLNDGGTAQSITFNPTGAGTIVLGSDAASLSVGTVVNIQGGTVKAATPLALGTTATVNLTSQGTLALGANQQISALKGAAGSVQLASNTLTIGSTDNLSGSFGGVISGSGIVQMSGTGTVTLSGSSTFGGSSYNTNGLVVPASTVINQGTVVAAGPSNISNGTILSGPVGTATVILTSGPTGTTSNLYLDNTPGRLLANPIIIGSSGPGTPTLGGLNTTGVTTYSGSVTLGSGNSGDNGHDLSIGATNGGEVAFTGSILANAGTGHSAITVNNLSGTGSAIVHFTGSNAYAGGTRINPNVTLAIGPSTSANGLGTGTVTLAGGGIALRGVLASGTQQTVAVTGFTADTILDQAAPNGTVSSTGTATSTIDGGSLFYENNYQSVTVGGLPSGGAITSASTGHAFQLAAYTGNNSLRYTSPGSQTLTLATPGQYASLDFLATSQNTAAFSITLTFADSTTDTIGGFSTADWYGGRAGFNAFPGLDPAQQNNNGTPSTTVFTNYGGALTMQEYDLAVPAADQSKTISGITVNATAVNGASAEVFAISGSTAAGSTPISNQTYANNFVVTTASSIDVSGSLNAAIGTLSMNGATLSVTSADTTTSPYSLTTGAVVFGTNVTTFNVARSAGGGAGTLVLGSLNDQGAFQTLTKTGPGTLILNSPATQVTDGSLYNIAAGTLVSNDPNALTYTDGANHLNLVGIGIAGGATFSIGASQAIDNLNDIGTPALNSGTLALNGFTLSIGSIHDRNSAFSGTITDGTAAGGSLVKGGSGTFTLGGSSTYTGSTTVSFGTLHLLSTGSLATSQLIVNGGATANIDGRLTATPAVTTTGTIKLGAADLNNDPASGILARTWGALTLNAGSTLILAPATTTATRTVLVTASLTDGGLIDLSNNDMIIHNGNLGPITIAGTISNLVQAGFNNGAQNGTSGILTSNVVASKLTTIGYAPGGNTFDGIATSSSDVLLKYTYYGDANLDGRVDGSDYSRIDSGYLTNATGWFNGDFNNDGVINGSDYTLIDNAFNTQGAQISAQLAVPTAQVAGNSSVPEPTSLGLLAIASASLLGRRRRQSQRRN